MKTKVCNGGGKTPKFGDEFQLQVTSPTEEIILRVWDKDLTTSDPIGFTKIKMSSLMINCGVTDWFTITFNNLPAGEILLESKFIPEGGNGFDQLKNKFEQQETELRRDAEQAKYQLSMLQ